MKSIKLLAASLAFVCSSAFALPYTWTDTVDPADVMIPPTYRFTFDISDGADGYRPFLDSITTYSVSFNLYDDASDPRFFPLETALINLPGILGDRMYFSLGGAESGGMSVEGWFQLALTGQLEVAIESVIGDFYFADATLRVNGNRVPEPGTLGLFGLALAGIAMARRKA